MTEDLAASSPGDAHYESERVEVLRAALIDELGILDTPPEPEFDRIARLAATLFEAPMALITFVDRDRIWFKSRFGVEKTESPRDSHFCGQTILQDDVFVVPDALADKRYQASPLVAGDLKVRSYAGIAIRENGGPGIGTLCIIDTVPRRLSARQKALLNDLAAMVMDTVRHRTLARRAITSEARLQDAIESLPDGFVMFDPDDRLIMCNQRYREIYDRTGDTIQVGRHFADIVREGLAQGQYPDAIGREEEWYTERMARHLNPSGPVEQQLPGDRWLRIDERPTPSGGVVGFRIDITALKRQERALSDLARNLEVQLTRAEEAQAAKVQFLAHVSHELRTPLNAIIGFSQVLGQELFGPLGLPKYLEYADDIQHSAAHLLSLVDDILDMAKLSSGKVELATETVHLGPVVDAAAKVVAPLINGKAIKLTLSTFDRAATARADVRALRQVLINLLSNAGKFTPPHGTITVTSCVEGSMICLCVTDTGPGIPEEILPKLGQPFQRVGNVMTSGEGGSGLGLAISRALVEGMGGQLEIDSELRAGTSVQITLPIAREMPPTTAS